MTSPLVIVDKVGKSFNRSAADSALETISFTIKLGMSVGLVGPNGSGKTTLARMIAGLEKPTVGTVLVDGHNPNALFHNDRKLLSKLIGFVPQEQTNALDPLMTVGEALFEPLALRGQKLQLSILEAVLAEVGLETELLTRTTSELSTGQRQRLAVARSLLATPKLLILDEVTTALDSDAKDRIARLLKERQAKASMAMLIIDHGADFVERVTQTVEFLGRPAVESLFAR